MAVMSDDNTSTLDIGAIEEALWKAEAKVSTQLSYVEANLRDRYARQRAEQSLQAALGEAKRCLTMRASAVRARKMEGSTRTA